MTESLPDNPRYVMDTNCIIEGQNSLYATDVFPVLWEKIEALIANGELYLPQAVIDEIAVKLDDSNSWVTTHTKNQFSPSVAQLEGASKMFGKLVNDYPKKREGADLRIISAAKALGATVVTLEKPPGANKIPTICKSEGVDCVSLMGMMQKERWIFK